MGLVAPRRSGAQQICLADDGQGRAVQYENAGIEEHEDGGEEGEEGSGSGVVGVGVGGAARCARHHSATAPRELPVDKVASMLRGTGAGGALEAQRCLAGGGPGRAVKYDSGILIQLKFI